MQKTKLQLVLLEAAREGLAETEEYYKYKTQNQSTGKLNRKLARWLYDHYSDTEFLYYNPKGVTQKAALDTTEPQNLGALEPVPDNGGWWWHRTPDSITLDNKRKRLLIHGELTDPRLSFQLISLADVFPEFKDYPVFSHGYTEKRGSFDQPLGTLSQLLSGKKKVSGKFQSYNREGNTFEEFEIEVLQDITELVWYHATKRANWNSIKRVGLVPSKEFLNPQQHGWTFMNMDLQNAVYLTHELDYARQIAKTLEEKHDEPAIVVQVRGDGLSDKEKIVVDEDALRNEYTDQISGGMSLKGMPEYVTSLVSNLKAIGYKGIISPAFLSIVR